MIRVTRLNHTPVILNCELIEHIETTPDTVISLTTGQKFMVLESAEEIVELVLNFRRAIIGPVIGGWEQHGPTRASGHAKPEDHANGGL